MNQTVCVSSQRDLAGLPSNEAKTAEIEFFVLEHAYPRAAPLFG